MSEPTSESPKETEKTNEVANSSASPSAEKKSNMGGQIVWLFVLGAIYLAITHGPDYLEKQKKAEKENRAQTAENPKSTTPASTNADTNNDTSKDNSKALSPAPATTQTTPPSASSASSKVISAPDRSTRLLLLTPTLGIRADLHTESSPKASARFQLTEVKELSTSSSSHPSILPATLGHTYLDHLSQITENHVTKALHLTGLTITPDGQTQTLTYTLSPEGTLQQRSESSSNNTANQSTTTYTPLLYFLSQN